MQVNNCVCRHFSTFGDFSAGTHFEKSVIPDVPNDDDEADDDEDGAGGMSSAP